MGSAESTLPPMEDTASTSRNTATNQENSTRPRREPTTEIPGTSDDPWWWEIENENLLLDRVPNVTTESSEVQATAAGSVTLSEDFNTLLKIGENVNMTLSNNNNMQASAIAEETTNLAIEKTEYPSNELAKTDYSQHVDTGKHTSASTATATDDELDQTAATRAQTLDEFKEELRLKRMARQSAVQDLREEIQGLRKQLTQEQALTRRLRQREEFETNETFVDARAYPAESAQHAAAKSAAVVFDEDDENVCSRSRHANIELANAQLALQLANSENLSLRTELGVTQKQVGTLKEVVACCKQMLSMKEEQCTQLKTKLSEIEDSFGEREMKIMSDNLRQEYERQLGNIRQLRQLYEERQRIAAAEHENLQRLISIKKDELAAEQERTKNSEERIQTLLKEVETANNELATLREECNEHKFEKKALKEEMGAVNTLFSQLLMGFNGKNNLDIDRLATMLEENRTLLNDMATKEANCSDGATLPKLLFELVEQAAVGSRSPTPYSDTATETEQELESLAVPSGDVHVDMAADQVLVQRANNVNQHDKCEAHEAAVGNVEAPMQDSEGATDVASIVVPGSLEDNVNNVSNNNNNGNISGNNKKHHHRKITANNNNKSSASASLDNNTSFSCFSAAAFKFHEPEVIGQVATTQEIIGNLPKVWKVLMELLSHHKIEQVQFEEHGASEDCYKSVETPNGPKAELSVSKTYIKLKDLILEKKSLVKETNRLKTLNCHLDYRLNEQEKRLSAVSLELTKTWHLVGKMQRQHRQLHTQEQILRYQLQQKRRLLTELKDELEYCRRKWAAARAKNDESQEQCNDLRREFAKRKLEDANNSAESGYSDSGSPSDEEGVRAAAAAAVLPVPENMLEHVAVPKVGCERNLRARFEHSRKIKRMQSTSPGRAASAGQAGEIVELRWNSAPPTCGWDALADDEEDVDEELCAAQGAIPKRNSRSKQRLREAAGLNNATAAAAAQLENASEESAEAATPTGDRAVRIQRLEEQCKSLIQQVLETSDNRERLEVQLCRFQDEIAPVQYAIPLNELITKKRIERMTRASSAPVAGTLTAREEEYTRKRSERLGRLEEESRQLISRIKRTTDRGHYLRCSLERLHKTRMGSGANISREGSFESNTEEEQPSGDVEMPEAENNVIKALEKEDATSSPLTANEQAYSTRRSERLKRLEAESKELLTTLARSTQRGSSLAVKLDALHEQHGGKDEQTTTSAASPTTEKRLENIERISSNRAERLRILEEEGKQLISRLSSTSERGTRMINRIAEREQSRAARQTETAAREATPTAAAASNEIEVSESGAPLLPMLKNVACSSIVGEELASCVTVTTTSSQIAQGAVPKTQPLAQLSVAAKAKAKSPTVTPAHAPQLQSEAAETLEQMVRRLQNLPFPETVVESVEQTQPKVENAQKSEEA